MQLNHHDTLITGASRSGTSLTCRLLNQLPDTVALVGPIKLRRFCQLDHGSIGDEVRKWLERERARICASGLATTRQVAGKFFDNGFAAGADPRGVRRRIARRGRVPIDKPLTPNFLLCVKNDPGFTAILPALAGRFRCFAIVRNPLATLASWNSLDHRLRDGHSPAERFDPDLARTLARIDDRLDRQITLLDWFLERYRRCLHPSCVIRYEDIVQSGGKALCAVCPAADALAEPLESRNSNPVYDRAIMAELAGRLLARDGAFWHFYSRSSVQDLCESIAARGTPQ